MQRLMFLMGLMIGLNSGFCQKAYFHFHEFPISETNHSSAIIDMHQDHLGYIWLFGVDGVSRFNGKTFTKIEEIYPSTKSISEKHVRALAVDETYNTFFGTYGGGLFMVDKKGILNNFQDLIELNDSLLSTIFHVIIARQGQLWILGDRGLEVFEKSDLGYKKLKLEFISNPEKVGDINSNRLEDVWISEKGKVVQYNISTKQIRTHEGFQSGYVFSDKNGNPNLLNREKGNFIYTYNSSSENFEKSDYQPFSYIKKHLRIACDYNNNVWASDFDDQFYAANLDTGEMILNEENQHNITSTKFIRKPFVDKSGAVWLNHEKTYMLPYNTGFFSFYPTSKNNQHNVDDILIGDDHHYLAIQSEGLKVVDNSTSIEKLYTTTKNGLKDIHIGFLGEMENDNIAVGTLGSFQIFNPKKGFLASYKSRGSIRSFNYDENYYYIGGLSSIMKISKTTGKTEFIISKSIHHKRRNAIHEIMHRDNESFWVAGGTNGIQIFEKETNTFKNTSVSNVNINDFKLDYVNDASLNQKGSLISIGTVKGIQIFDIINEKIINSFSTIGFVNSIEFQNDSIIWASGQDRLWQCNCLSLVCQDYTTKDGLLNSDFTLRSSFNKNGKIYFGGDKGIDAIFETSYRTNPFPPFLNISSIIVNKEDTIQTFETKTYELHPSTQVAEIFIDAIHPSHKDNLQLTYKYANDDKWVKIKHGQPFTLINPKKGIQKILFQVASGNGIKSEVQEITIDFKRIWYKTTLFRVIMSLFIVGLILGAIIVYNRNKRRVLKTQYRLTEEINQLRMQALDSQMNPHFIFNAMSSIQQMIGAGESRLASDYLNTFSRLLRHALQYSSDSKVSLENELNFIENYLKLEQARFEDTFKYDIHFEPNINPIEIEIPTFFIQPQLENAIKHGIRNSPDKGIIKVNASLNKNILEICISDNGIGRKKASKYSSIPFSNTKRGIELTKKRIEQLNSQGKYASFSIQDLNPKNTELPGTLVTLKFEI